MLSNMVASYNAARKFRSYRPVPVTYARVWGWFRQFPSHQHRGLRTLLQAVEFIDEPQMTSDLKALNERLLSRLGMAGIAPAKVIYVSFDQAGSSSGAVLNLVRDACRLENRGCSFVDGKDLRGLHEATSKLESGAIVYVDDFVGSGNQFCAARDDWAQYIVGTFSEYLLVHVMCEEGMSEIGRRNAVEPVPVRLHGRAVRPLHALGSVLPDLIKGELRDYCLAINRRYGLGFREIASMVVYYRNSPNTVPLILRGSRGQSIRGVLPRTTDLGVD